MASYYRSSLEALVGEVFLFTKSATKKFALLAFACLERTLHLFPKSEQLHAEMEPMANVIADTFFVHPVEEISQAAGKLYTQMVSLHIAAIPSKVALVERCLKNFNTKSSKLAQLNCQLLTILLMEYKIPGKLIVDQILHLLVSSLQLLKSSSGSVYRSRETIYGLIFECFQ